MQNSAHDEKTVLGIALSHGGVRSTAYATGVLGHMFSHLHPHDRFYPQYISTCSGGGFCGISFVQHLRCHHCIEHFNTDSAGFVKEFTDHMREGRGYFCSNCSHPCKVVTNVVMWTLMFFTMLLLNILSILPFGFIIACAFSSTFGTILGFKTHYPTEHHIYVRYVVIISSFSMTLLGWIVKEFLKLDTVDRCCSDKTQRLLTLSFSVLGIMGACLGLIVSEVIVFIHASQKAVNTIGIGVLALQLVTRKLRGPGSFLSSVASDTLVFYVYGFIIQFQLKGVINEDIHAQALFTILVKIAALFLFFTPLTRRIKDKVLPCYYTWALQDSFMSHDVKTEMCKCGATMLCPRAPWWCCCGTPRDKDRRNRLLFWRNRRKGSREALLSEKKANIPTLLVNFTVNAWRVSQYEDNFDACYIATDKPGQLFRFRSAQAQTPEPRFSVPIEIERNLTVSEVMAVSAARDSYSVGQHSSKSASVRALLGLHTGRYWITTKDAEKLTSVYILYLFFLPMYALEIYGVWSHKWLFCTLFVIGTIFYYILVIPTLLICLPSWRVGQNSPDMFEFRQQSRFAYTGDNEKSVPSVYISGAVHSDGIGLLSLLDRGCSVIICVDCSRDKDMTFRDLRVAMHLARRKLGVGFRVNGCLEYDIDSALTFSFRNNYKHCLVLRFRLSKSHTCKGAIQKGSVAVALAASKRAGKDDSDNQHYHQHDDGWLIILKPKTCCHDIKNGEFNHKNDNESDLKLHKHDSSDVNIVVSQNDVTSDGTKGKTKRRNNNHGPENIQSQAIKHRHNHHCGCCCDCPCASCDSLCGKFPHTSSMNTCYTESLFDSYRELGEEAIMEALSVIETSSNVYTGCTHTRTYTRNDKSD